MNRKLFLTISALVCFYGQRVAAKDLVLQAATLDHPHVRAILDGRVKVPGCQVHLSTRSVEALRQAIKDRPAYDLWEVELVPFLEEQSAGRLTDYVLVPVFLFRGFQLRNVYVRTDRGIKGPPDLRGKTIGVSAYDSSAPTWVRGVLQTSWGINPGEITWLDKDTSTQTTRSLSDWLKQGTVDAVITSFPPQVYLDKDPRVTRMQENYKDTEAAQFQKSRIFPIITALALRKSIVDKNPWVSEALFKAFSEAKKKSIEEGTFPLPWEGVSLQETERLMGSNFWSYGVKSNPKTLGALFRYLEEQKLLQQPVKLIDVFDSSTLLLLED